MNFDYTLKVVSMPLERLERLEDLGRAHFPREWREHEIEDRQLHNDEQPEDNGKAGLRRTQQN